MNLDKIIETLPRDEYHIQYLHHFKNSNVVGNVSNYVLKRNIIGIDIYYGLIWNP